MTTARSRGRSDRDTDDGRRCDVDGRRACARGSTRTCRVAWQRRRGPPAAPAAIRAVRTRAEYEEWYPAFAASGSSCRPGRSRTAGSTSRPRRARASKPSCARSTSGGSTRSASTSPRPRCSRTAPRSNACASCRRSCATKRCGASCSASRAPVPTSRRWRRAPCATATTGSSPARRCGPRGRTVADFGVLLARTDPDVAEAAGHHVLPARPAPARRRRATAAAHHRRGRLQRGVPRSRAWSPTQRVGAVGDGWKVANATLSGERQMVSGAGSGGVDRIGAGAAPITSLAISADGRNGGWDDPSCARSSCASTPRSASATGRTSACAPA